MKTEIKEVKTQLIFLKKNFSNSIVKKQNIKEIAGIGIKQMKPRRHRDRGS